MYSFRQPFQDAKKDKKKPTSAKKGEEKDKSKDKGRTELLHIFMSFFHFPLTFLKYFHGFYSVFIFNMASTNYWVITLQGYIHYSLQYPEVKPPLPAIYHIYYCLHLKDGEGNVFTGVCLSTGRGDGGGTPVSSPLPRSWKGYPSQDQHRGTRSPQTQHITDRIRHEWYASYS